MYPLITSLEIGGFDMCNSAAHFGKRVIIQNAYV